VSVSDCGGPENRYGPDWSIEGSNPSPFLKLGTARGTSALQSNGLLVRPQPPDATWDQETRWADSGPQAVNRDAAGREQLAAKDGLPLGARRKRTTA